MKKRRPTGSSLFPEDTPVEYVVDTSSWIYLNEHRDRDKMLLVVVRLIADDRLFSPTIVVGTRSALGEVISARELVEPHLEQLARCDRNDADFLINKVGFIARKYTRLTKPTGSKTKADPYIVAYGMTGYTVVAEESLKHPSAKITGVCRLENIPCVTIEKMCERECQQKQRQR